MKVDRHAYRGWLNSDSFLKRAFAILGYSLIPALIVYGILVIIGILWVIIRNASG